MKAETRLVCHLEDPKGEWVNIEEVTAPEEKAIAAFLLQKMAKIIGEGGILEMQGPLSWDFIPLRRISKMSVSANVLNIEAGTEGALADAVQHAANGAALLRDPKSPILFRNKKNVN